MIRRITTSSMILAIGYRGGTLTIVFNSCRMYRYFNVPKEVYQQLLAAESKGRFFNQNIRDVYEYKERGIWTSSK